MNVPSARSRAAWVAFGLALFAAIDGLDYATRFEASLSLYYLAPIVIVTWFGARWAGILVSLASASPWWSVHAAASLDPYEQLIAWWNSIMEAGLYVSVTLVLSALKRALDRERALARTDPLTGAANGRGFGGVACTELERARRSGRPLTLAYLDIDDFKAINDRHGHKAGDALLRAVAEGLRAQLRKTDTLARLGGDEFAVLLPETEASQAREALDRARGALHERLRAGGWPATVSVGAATFLKPPAGVDEMIQKADALMYSVKGGGKGRLIQEVCG